MNKTSPSASGARFTHLHVPRSADKGAVAARALWCLLPYLQGGGARTKPVLSSKMGKAAAGCEDGAVRRCVVGEGCEVSAVLCPSSRAGLG